MGLQAALNREMTGFDPPSAYQLGIRSMAGPMTLNHQTWVRHLHPQPSMPLSANGEATRLLIDGIGVRILVGAQTNYADVVTMVST